MKTILKTTILVVTLFIIACSSDDDSMVNDAPSLTSEQLNGFWKVTYFKNQVDKTSDYIGDVFFFDLEDDIKVNADEIRSDASGQWNLFQDQIGNKEYSIIEMVFDQNSGSTQVDDRLRELTEEWIVKRVLDNANKLELEERISNNPQEILHLEKLEL